MTTTFAEFIQKVPITRYRPDCSIHMSHIIESMCQSPSGRYVLLDDVLKYAQEFDVRHSEKEACSDDVVAVRNEK